MHKKTFLSDTRRLIDQTWLIALFACVYVVSQTTIILILGPIEDAMMRLQTTGTAVADYVSVFGVWQSTGDMAFYRAHFVLDDVHWIWYTVLATALLSRLFNRLDVSQSNNWVLALPLASGLLDWFENRLQHVFLSNPDFSTIIHPLPLISTLASDIKWLLALGYIGAILILSGRLLLRSENKHSQSGER